MSELEETFGSLTIEELLKEIPFQIGLGEKSGGPVISFIMERIRFLVSKQ